MKITVVKLPAPCILYFSPNLILLLLAIGKLFSLRPELQSLNIILYVRECTHTHTHKTLKKALVNILHKKRIHTELIGDRRKNIV